MSGPRELAEQAMSLLQDALRASEERVNELGEELKRKSQPRGNAQHQVAALTHRLEKAESECERWKREAEQLEDVVDAERAKLHKLKKKLEIAESGPDKLTRQEVNFWRAKSEDFDKQAKEYKQRIAALRRELKQRGADVDRLAAEQAEAMAAEAKARAQSAEAEIEALRRDSEKLQHALEEALAAGEARSAELTAKLEQLDSERADQEQRLSSLEKAAGHLRDTLAERDSRIATLSGEVEQLRVENQRLDEQRSSVEARVQDADAERARAAAELEEQRRERERLAAELEEHRGERARLTAELEEHQRERERVTAELEEHGRQRERLAEELEEQRGERERVAAELESRRQEDDRRAMELAADLDAKRQELRELTSRLEDLEGARNAAREQIAGLEAELKEEKECSENLAEIANERRDQLTKLEEQVEEAQERYEEASYRLGKAAHYERMARRRRKIVASLIESLRSKQKSNTALKAGLDALRTYKASAEANQQKLLSRIDSLKSSLGAAEEALARQQGGAEAKEKLTAAETRCADLEQRLATQAELIQTLEDDLKTAKAFKRDAADVEAELEQLRRLLDEKDQELQAKGQLLATLQSELDEEARELRRTASETARLRTISEQEKGLVDNLQREVAQLREALARAGNGEADPADVDSRVLERDRRIAELEESVAAWKRKYEFLSTEAPSAYQSAAEK